MMQEAIRLIKTFEGFSPVVYICPAGFKTIGYGHIVLPEEEERFKKAITESEGEELLYHDLLRFQVAINRLIKIQIHDLMFQAILSFSYNVGVYAFRASTLRRLVNEEAFEEAALQFPRWIYVGGRQLKGLLRRRIAERELFLKGVKEL
jgi:lysozyme